MGYSEPLQDQRVLRNCLTGSRRVLLFIVEKVCLQMGAVWSMHTSYKQCIVGKKGDKRTEGIDDDDIIFAYGYRIVPALFTEKASFLH